MHNERYSILYSSATGNTRLLADTIRAALPPELCDAFGAAGETAAESELLYVGFWTDKGNADADTLALLRTLKNKRLFLFGTAGFGVDTAYFDAILARVQAVPDGSNTVIGTYMCQGKMPPSVRARYAPAGRASPHSAHAPRCGRSRPPAGGGAARVSRAGNGGNGMWFVFALLSAVFAALTSILAKVGIEGVNSNLATAIRTMVVLAMAWGMVFVTNTQGGLTDISRKSWLFLILSGLATGASWLCYYRALQIGEASKVVPIDKLSVVITLVLAFVFLHERFTPKSLIGCLLIGAGTLLMVL